MRLILVLLMAIGIGTWVGTMFYSAEKTEVSDEVLELMKNIPRTENQEPDDAMGTHIIDEHKFKVIEELKGMGYSEYLVYDYYMIKPCPDGHLGFAIAFTGMQFKTNRKYGYLCPPYHHEMVYYSNKALF